MSTINTCCQEALAAWSTWIATVSPLSFCVVKSRQQTPFLLKGVIIGENVGFDSLINVPAGVMLTDTLSKIAVPGSTEGVERVALDLRSTPLPGAAEAPRTSYLELDYYSYYANGDRQTIYVFPQ